MAEKMLGAEMIANKRAAAENGLGAMRTRLRKAKEEFPVAKEKLQEAIRHPGVLKPEWGDTMDARKERVEKLKKRIPELEAEVLIREQEIYGDWAPKQPPSIERMERIRKQRGTDE